MDDIVISVSIRVATAVVITMVVLVWRFSFDIWQFFTRRDFGNVNVYLVYFTRNDIGSDENTVEFEGLESKIPLREICRNRYLFWVIIWRSLKVTPEQPVLNFGKKSRNVLRPVLGRISRTWTGMLFKRAGGMSFKKLDCKLALVYDLSEESRSFVIKVIVIQDRDINDFDIHLKSRPMNSNNLKLVKRIVESYREKTGSFIDVRITIA